MADPFAPQNYYDTLTGLYRTLFGENWHLGYWLNAEDFAGAGRRLNRLMIAKLLAGPGTTVADVGCGIGGPTCDIADQTGCDVVGFTNSQQGVAGAEALARERGALGRVRFELGDASALSSPGEAFDAVFSCEAIHNVQDKPALTRELSRVLKRGGRLVVGDLFLLRPDEQLTVSLDRLRSFSFHLFRADEWIDWLRGDGVEVIESVNIGHHVGPRSLAHCIETCRSRAGVATPGSLEQVILTRTVEATTLLAEGFERGDLGWGIWVGEKA